MRRLLGCRDGPSPIRLVLAEKEEGGHSMAGPYDAEHSEHTQRSEWAGAGEPGSQEYAEAGGSAPAGGHIGGYGQYQAPGTFGAYGIPGTDRAYPGESQSPGWGYADQPGGSGTGWGYAPGYAPPAGPRSTSRPLPGAPEQAPPDTQGWTGGYAGGYYGPPSQSLQPFQPPQPPYGSYGSYGQSGGAYGGGYGPYGAYGTYGPASGYGGYGQYGPQSQYGGYGQFGPPAQWGPPVVIEAPARQPWSMRRKVAVFGGLVALLLVLAGGGLGYTQYNAPVAAANQICSDFQSQRYVDMYGLFDAQLQAQMTSVQFAQSVLDLDRAQGQTAKCEVAVHANGFTDSGTTATFVLTRPNADDLQGAAHLKNEGGSWKVTALDQSLFGIDLRALNSVDNYCTALLSQTYDAAYGMLDKAQQGKQKQADFRQDATWRDEIDGNATACHAAAIGANSDSTASITLSVTRSRAGEHQGAFTLAVEGTTWKVHNVADEALGRDIGPIRTGMRFCADLAKGNYTDITTLLAGLITNVGEVESAFSGAYNGIKWTGCTLDISTFTLSGSSASLVATFTIMRLSDGNTGSAPVKVEFTRVGHDWKISNMTDPNK